jgi:hypothetical protein
MREFRMICLTCISTDFVKQVDLCLSCIDTSIITGQFDHKPHHPLVKIKWLLQDREKPKLMQDALNAVERAKALFSASATRAELISAIVAGGTTEDDCMGTSEQDSAKLCICCNKSVSVPFWICVSCGEETSLISISMLTPHPSPVDTDTLICIDCDANKRPPFSSGSTHHETHPLVRYQHCEVDPSSEVKTIESKLASLETSINERLDRLEKRIANHDLALDERFERLEQRIEQRLDSMESLLRAFVARESVA